MKNENNQHTPTKAQNEVFTTRMYERAKIYRENWKLPEETKDGYNIDNVYRSGYVHGLSDEREGFFETSLTISIGWLLKENKKLNLELKDLHKLNDEVLQDNSDFKKEVRQLQALNAELLEQLKEAELIALVATREEYIKGGMSYDDAFKAAPENHRIVAMRSAIAKAESKNLVG